MIGKLLLISMQNIFRKSVKVNGLRLEVRSGSSATLRVTVRGYRLVQNK